jgi:hypothetical protein
MLNVIDLDFYRKFRVVLPLSYEEIHFLLKRELSSAKTSRSRTSRPIKKNPEREQEF